MHYRTFCESLIFNRHLTINISCHNLCIAPTLTKCAAFFNGTTMSPDDLVYAHITIQGLQHHRRLFGGGLSGVAGLAFSDGVFLVLLRFEELSGVLAATLLVSLFSIFGSTFSDFSDFADFEPGRNWMCFLKLQNALNLQLISTCSST